MEEKMDRARIGKTLFIMWIYGSIIMLYWCTWQPELAVA